MDEIKKMKLNIKEIEKEMYKVDSENQEMLEKIENLMMLIKQEEYLSQVLQDKTKELEKHFGLMQPYMILCNKTFSKLSSCKLY